MSQSSLDFFRDASDGNYFEMNQFQHYCTSNPFFLKRRSEIAKKKSNSVFITDVRIIETNNEL